MKNKKGFTLIEILAVIVIIAILSGVVIFAVSKYIKKGKDEFNHALENELVAIAKDYYSENLAELPNGYFNEDKIPTYTSLKYASELISKGFISNDFVDSDGNLCSSSYVIVENKGSNEYEYIPCLVCENNGYKTDNPTYCNFDNSSVDNVDPWCEITATNATNGVVDGNINFEIKAYDTGSGIALMNVNGVSTTFTEINDVYIVNKTISYDVSAGSFIAYIYDKAGNVGMCSNPEDIIINKTPVVTISATKKDTSETVDSDVWSNKGLNYTLTESNVGQIKSTIYYCKDTTNTCNPTTVSTSGTAITDYNNDKGKYYIRYYIENSNGKSDIQTYIAKVDTTPPTCEFELVSGVLAKDSVWWYKNFTNSTAFDSVMEDGWYSNEEAITLNLVCIDEESGLKSYSLKELTTTTSDTYRYEPTLSNNNTISYPQYTNNEDTAYIYAIDNAGNIYDGSLKINITGRGVASVYLLYSKSGGCYYATMSPSLKKDTNSTFSKEINGQTVADGYFLDYYNYISPSGQNCSNLTYLPRTSGYHSNDYTEQFYSISEYAMALERLWNPNSMYLNYDNGNSLYDDRSSGYANWYYRIVNKAGLVSFPAWLQVDW